MILRVIAALIWIGIHLGIAGTRIDAKLARRDPSAWQTLLAATSIVPFVAIAQGRNRFVSETG
jgi:uncharacterized membrane protein